MTSNHLNRMIEQHSQWEEILPYLQGEDAPTAQLRKEVERRIEKFNSVIKLEQDTIKSWLHFVLDTIETDSTGRLAIRLSRIVEDAKKKGLV